jgi:hypothetical protein
LEVDLPEGDSLLWTGVEVRAKDADWKHAEVVTALWPYSHGWFDHAPLRPPLNDQVAKRKGLLQQALEDAGPEGLTRALRSLKFDPFSTSRKDKGDDAPWRYTARLSNPQRVWGLRGIPLPNGHVLARRTNYRHAGDGRRSNPEWRLGVCEDAGAAVEALVNEAQAKHDILKMPRFGALHSALEEVATEILKRAVWLALAGNRDESKKGKPVLREVLRICAAELENADKRARRGEPPMVPLTDRDAAGPRGSRRTSMPRI